MTKRQNPFGSSVTIERLIERCKGMQLKTLVGQIAPALTALGYREFKDKTPCMIGSHNIVTIELCDVCPQCNGGIPCPRPVKIQWSVNRGVLERGCGSYDCPCDEYAVQTNDNTENSVTLHHIAHHSQRRKVVEPAPQHL